MKDATSRPLALRDLSAIHRIEFGVLAKWQKEGIDVTNSIEVSSRAIKSARPPGDWGKVKSIFEDQDDSHDYWKKAKTKEEVERLRLINAKASGEMFDKADGERIQEAWASALKLALAERQATAPQMLAGKDEAWIAEWIEEENRKLQSDLAELESGLWRQVYENYQSERPSADAEEGEQPSTKAKANGKPVVRGKRQPRSRANAKA